MREVVAGVDSSTQSCTVELRDVATGELVGSGRAPHPVTSPPVSEQDPQAWWDAFKVALDDARANNDVRIRGLSVGAQCHGLVAMDDEGRVIRKAKLWNDTTSSKQSSALLKQHPVEWWITEIGIVPSAALTITKLAWLRDNEPDAFARVRHLAVPHDYLTWRLTGRRVTDRSDASGTGYFSADSMSWRTDILNELIAERDWLPMLPTVLGPDQSAGTIDAASAAELGLDNDAVVGAGGGDQHLAAQGIGLVEGDVAYSLGTSGVVFTPAQQPVKDLSGAIDGVASVTGGYLPLVCTLNSTKVTDWAARMLGVTHAELGSLALAASVDADRPVLAAYLDGERSPRLPWASGMMSGLRTATSRESFALAAYEGVALGLVRGERRISSHGIPITGRTILVGGGARSEAYRQIIADLTGRPVVTVDAPEGTARGAAIQAAAAVRGDSITEVTAQWAPSISSTTHPRTDRGNVWERYERLTGLQADGTTF